MDSLDDNGLSDNGHNRSNLSVKDTSLGPKYSLSHSTNTFLTQKWLVLM